MVEQEYGEIQVTMSIGITPSLLELLDQSAEKVGMSRSGFVREAIEAMIAYEKESK